MAKVLTSLNTAFELDEAQPAAAFLPIGATEQHSRHLPMLTDTLIADKLSTPILEKSQSLDSVYLLPTLPYSSSEENTGFTGTLSLTPACLRSVIRDLFSSLEEVGITTLIVCSYHGGNFILKPIVREFNHERGKCHMIYLNPMECVGPEAFADFEQGYWEVHSGDVETSMMMAMHPEHVREEKKDNPMAFNPAWLDMHSIKTLSNGEGQVGNPSKATAAKGEEFLKDVIAGTATKLDELIELQKKHERY